MRGKALTFEEREHGNDTSGGYVDNQFVLPDRELLDVFWQTAHEPGTVPMHVICLCCVLVCWIDRRCTKASRAVWFPLSVSHVGGVWRHHYLGGSG